MSGTIAAFSDVSPDLFAIIDSDSYFIEHLNRSGRELLRIREDDLPGGTSLLEFIPGHCLWTLLNEAVPGAWRAKAWSGELELRCTDGTELAVTLVVMARPAEPGSGEHNRFWLTAHDISKTQHALQTLRRDQWYLRVLLENVPDSIYFKDLESRFLCVSHGMSTRAGVNDPRKMEGRTDFDFFTAEHAQPAFDAEQEIVKTERALVDCEEKETWANGRVTWASTTKLPLYSQTGQLVGTFGISRDITGRKHAEAALAQAQRNLVEASRMAGMAEIATGVLHNIGNALNSVNTSTTLITDQANKLAVGSLGKLVALTEQHRADLGEFLTKDPRGQLLPGFLAQLHSQFITDQQALVNEIRALAKSVDHIKSIIAMQQNYARSSTVLETLSPAELMEEAIRISEASLVRHQITVIREYSEVPPVQGARHRVLEILVNLLGNARQAVEEVGASGKKVTLCIKATDTGRVRLIVRDSGVGIAPENLQRIFSHGFTTRKSGHGFGLHSSAIAAQEMGATLTASSEGRGKGAEFCLEIPVSTGTNP